MAWPPWALAHWGLPGSTFCPGLDPARLGHPHAQREERLRLQHEEQRLAEFQAQPPVPRGAVLFAGASHIEYFPLDAAFGPGLTCNRGIGGEVCAELLERLPGTLQELRPGAIVLSLAANDFLQRDADAANIRSQVEKVFDRIAAQAPGVPAVVIGILPASESTPERIAELARINAGIASLCQERGVQFLGTDGAPFTTEGGRLAPEVAADRYHLNEAGYRALTRRWMQRFPEWQERLKVQPGWAAPSESL
ncbi:MAG: GDSL-type esterase/lipase family protein [Planctomycetota bacterium]